MTTTPEVSAALPVSIGRRTAVFGTLALLLVAALLGLRPALLEIHENWVGKWGHFAHGYAVLGFSIWLGVRAWRRRTDLLLKAEWRAVPVLMVLLAILVVALRLQITTISQSVVPAILICAFAVTLGMPVIRLLWWPAVCLYLAMPVWYVLNPILQAITTLVAGLLVRLAGVSVIVSGSDFELDNGIVEIASGCSGLNYLISALSIAYLYGMLYLQTWPARIRLLAFAAGVSMVMNWLRVFSLILIAYFTDMQHYLIKVDHLYYGWVLFLVALWPMFVYGARLERREEARGLRAPAPTIAPPVRIDVLSVLLAGLLASALLIAPLAAARILP